MKLKITCLAFLGILIYSCAPKIAPSPPPTPPIDKAIDVLVEISKELVESNDIVEGKSLYEKNCATCHKLYNPNDYSDTDWLPILDRMKKNANLTDIQHDKIYAYIVSN